MDEARASPQFFESLRERMDVSSARIHETMDEVHAIKHRMKHRREREDVSRKGIRFIHG